MPYSVVLKSDSMKGWEKAKKKEERWEIKDER